MPRSKKKEDWLDWLKIAGNKLTTPGIGPYADMWIAYGIVDGILEKFPDEELIIAPKGIVYEISWSNLTREDVSKAMNSLAEKTLKDPGQFPLGWKPSGSKETSPFPMQYDPTLSKGLISVKVFGDAYAREEVPVMLAVLAAHAVKEYAMIIESGNLAQFMFFSPNRLISSSELLAAKELGMSSYYSDRTAKTLAHTISFLELPMQEGFDLNVLVLEKGNKGYQFCRKTWSGPWKEYFEKVSQVKYLAAEEDAFSPEAGEHKVFHELYSFLNTVSQDEKYSSQFLLFLKTGMPTYLYNTLRKMAVDRKRKPSSSVINCFLSNPLQKK